MSEHNTKGLKVIVGLGKTGLSCAQFLSEVGESIAITDSRENPPGLTELKKNYPHIPIITGGLDKALLQQADTLIVSPGLSLQEPLIAERIAARVPVIGDIELFAQHVKKPICAITGSNAKSTVTTLVGEMAANAGIDVRVGGNLGTPALDLIQKTAQMYVLELSSFQLETTHSLKPTAACILNISPDHLDRYTDMAAYIAAKQRIYQNAEWIIYNREDPHTIPSNKFSQHNKTVTFGLSQPKDQEFGFMTEATQRYLAFGQERLLSVEELQISGSHNWANALAALALGYAMKIPMQPMLQTLKTFKGLAHRCELVGQKNGVSWYNDSKGTNVGAALAAIEGIGRAVDGKKLIMIMGGLGKGQDFSVLAQALSSHAKLVILLGQDAPLIAAAVQKQVDIEFATTLDDAINKAYQHAQTGDAVLLSPACASFDMFRDYVHRGEEFKRIAQEYLT